MKRCVDILGSALGVVLLSPVLLLVALIIKLDSPGPVFFRQERVGRGFRPFRIIKFRSMRCEPSLSGRAITVGDDPRITRFGRLLRKTKFDEIPQLFNVLRGEMSLVGPRPELPHYVQKFRPQYAGILAVPPGITDLASLTYSDESSLLALSADPEEEYVGRILPFKIALAQEYIRRQSVLFDLEVVLCTLLKLMGISTRLSQEKASTQAEPQLNCPRGGQ